MQADNSCPSRKRDTDNMHENVPSYRGYSWAASHSFDEPTFGTADSTFPAERVVRTAQWSLCTRSIFPRRNGGRLCASWLFKSSCFPVIPCKHTVERRSRQAQTPEAEEALQPDGSSPPAELGRDSEHRLESCQEQFRINRF